MRNRWISLLHRWGWWRITLHCRRIAHGLLLLLRRIAAVRGGGIVRLWRIAAWLLLWRRVSTWLLWGISTCGISSARKIHYYCRELGKSKRKRIVYFLAIYISRNHVKP